MKNIIRTSKLKGQVWVPGSKSYAQRAILMASLMNHLYTISNAGVSQDVNTAIFLAKGLGAKIDITAKSVTVKGRCNTHKSNFYAGDSGLSGRIISVILLFIKGEFELSGSKQLSTRPFDALIEIAEQLGRPIFLKNQSLLPIHYSDAPIHIPDKIEIRNNLSSQFISGLLMVLSVAEYKGKLQVHEPKSKPYIRMTMNILSEYGFHWQSDASFQKFTLDKIEKLGGQEIQIEGDWSGAAHLISCAICSHSEILLCGLNPLSLQADRLILEHIEHEWVEGKLFIPSQHPDNFTAHLVQAPDLFPAFAAMSAVAKSPSVLYGLHRLRHKESDRAHAIQSELGKIGVKVNLEVESDRMTITPKQTESKSVAHDHNDHRICMMMTAIGLSPKYSVEIENSNSVSKSYPNFFNDLRTLGAEIDLVE